MGDLTERLRTKRRGGHDQDCLAAADEIESLRSALAKSASREAALVEKLKVATDLLDEGNKGFGRILIASSDDKAVRDWQKRCGAALAKIKEAS